MSRVICQYESWQISLISTLWSNGKYEISYSDKMSPTKTRLGKSKVKRFVHWEKILFAGDRMYLNEFKRGRTKIEDEIASGDSENGNHWYNDDGGFFVPISDSRLKRSLLLQPTDKRVIEIFRS